MPSCPLSIRHPEIVKKNSHRISTPRSKAQTAASRDNGAKSRGPTTPEGKAASSQNATTHGLRSSRVVLANESQDRYHELLAAYRAEWNPVGQSENDFLVELVNARWRLRRIWAQETAMLDSEMFLQKPEFDLNFSVSNPAMRQTDAIMAIAAGSPVTLEYLHRAESRLSRACDRALKNLVRLQTLRLSHPPKLENCTNEPENVAQPPESPPQPSACVEPNYLEPETFAWLSSFTPTPLRPTPCRAHWGDPGNGQDLAPPA